jgi:hypothetical protein
MLRYTKEIDLFAELSNRINDYFCKGVKSADLLRLIKEYRFEIYKTDNPDIAIVENGVIRAIEKGNTIVRVKSNNIELIVNVEVR